ncbi:MAG: pyridoxal phosphate-dependent aminotransferase [Planctomycetota bacterium]
MEFNPMIEASKFWTLRGNPALISGKRLKQENIKWTHQGITHGVIFCNIGDTHLEKDIVIPQVVKKAVHRCIEQQRICYTFSEGDPSLIKSISAKFGVSDTEIFITNGVTEAILFLGRLFGQIIGKPEDGLTCARRKSNWPGIVLVSPVYPPWNGIMMEYGLKVNLACRHDSGKLKGQANIAEIKNKINSGTQAVVLIPADNPTGKVLPPDNIEEVAKLLVKEKENGKDIFLIVDDVYREFIDPKMRVDYIKLADKYKLPLILLGGIDKVLGTGFHGGWMIIHVPKELERLHKLTPDTMRLIFAKYTGANTITQYAMMPYFNDYNRVLSDIKKNLKKFHNWSNKYIKGFKTYSKNYLRFKYGPPELPLYLWLELVPKNVWANATEFADDLVKTTGVLVAPGDPFGDKNCIRISVVRDPLKPLNIPKIIIDFMRRETGFK